MKSTDAFKSTIQAHLNNVATNDELFAETLKNPLKNIDDCITYIMNTVQKSGCNGFADDEIFNMAIHYYDEQNIEVGKAISGKVVVNHHVEITAEEKAEMKKKALDDVLADERRKLTQKKSTTTTQKEEVQASLFDTFGN
jgi:hypothetical protein